MIKRTDNAQAVQGMVGEFYPETSHLMQGQIQWVIVDKGETSFYGKSMRQTNLKSVVLDLVRSFRNVPKANVCGRSRKKLR